MYCTQAQMVERFGEQLVIQLTDRDHAGEINEAVLAAAMADAAAEIDMYLAGRYTLPLSSVPLTLTRLACILTRDVLATGSDVSDERWSKQADDARKLLREIAGGKVSLGVDALAQGAASGDGAQMESAGRIWGRDDSKGYL
ncbi:gp436 family protein [Geoalkalibacter halelectricus]|uniref:gp436 family protein n=1 Tax=Geoalkalibacter halelectricus TaxID=2847045 RepID=UPI003D25DED3